MHIALPNLVPPVRRFNATGGFFTVGGSIQWQEDPTLHGEAYRIEIRPTEIRLYYGTAVARVRAQATLNQLLTAQTLPCGDIEDAPQKSVRGCMLDVSRNRIYSLETLFEFVDHMVALKLNRLELYFENVFTYSAHPTAWKGTSPYTPDDMRRLSDYCNERFVELVPNQNTLGHFERWIKADESYRRYFELPNGGARTPWGSIQTTPTGLCTTDPNVVQLVKGLLNELLPAFPHARHANLGGDEVFDLGQGRSAGKGSPAELYLNYMKHPVAVAQQYGMQPELWADMLLRHPDLLQHAKSELPDVRWILWGYEASDPLQQQAHRLQEAGLDVIVAPGSSTWRSFCGRVTNMEANIRQAAAIDSPGLLLTDWGDAGHWQPLTITLPPLILAAAQAWNRDGTFQWEAAIDTLTHTKGLGDFLLRLGHTSDLDPIKVGNATRLFRDYNLPYAPLPDEQRPALEALRETLIALDAQSDTLGSNLYAQEARLALNLQRLALERALGTKGLAPLREQCCEQLQRTWFARGPRAQWDASRADFLAPNLP